MLWFCQMQRNSFCLQTLAKIYKLEYETETTIFIKFNKTGAANVHTNVFIFAETFLYNFFEMLT